MAVYLVEHPPATQQYRCPRDEHPSGVIGVHTAENHPDESPPDDGAENVARFIANRSTYGSYHWIVDSDSRIQLVEHDCVAYHIGTHGLNEHTVGISAATQAHKWDDLPGWWVDATVRNMARAAADAARWLQSEHGITVPARRITLSQALDRQPGFIAHADADPDRRTDPGASFPWSTFLDYYAAEMGDSMSWSESLDPTDLAASRFPDNYSTRAEHVLMHILGLAYNANWGDIDFAGWMADRWGAASLSPRVYLRSGYGHAREAKDRIRDEVTPLLQEIRAAQGGGERDQVLADIQAELKAARDEREAISDQLDGVADLLEQHNAGSISPEAVVDGVRDLLHQATAPADDSDA